MFINQLFRSFAHAVSGIRTAFKEEQSFRVQIAAAIFVIVLMFVFSLNIIEKSVLILLIIIVLALEMLNSILERLIDVYKPRLHSYVRDIKDIAAGAVFLASLGAAVVGILIFYPYIRGLLPNVISTGI